MVGILENPVEPVGAVGPSAEAAPTAAAAPKRIKRLERPNKATLDEDVGKVYDEVDAIQARIYEIKQALDSKQQNKQASSAEVQDGLGLLKELNASFRSVLEEKKAIREELDQADKAREKLRADARAIRDKLPYTRVELIDEEIKKLEHRMTHTSLTLQEEKKVLQQVKDLTKSRDSVRDYNERMDQITHDEGFRPEFLDRIREKDHILNDLKAKQEEQKKVLSQIRDKDASHSVDMPALFDERNAAFEKIKALREHVKKLKGEFRTKEEEYWERERQWKEQQAIQRRKDYEKREADRKEREKIRKQRELENYVEPYTDEIIMVDQLISYLQKYAPSESEAAAASAAAPQKAEVVAPKGVGTVLVSKKNKFDEENDSWFSGKSKGKKNKAPAAQKSKAKEKLSLSLDALTSFEKVKLAPPTTVSDVGKSIDDLKLKKEDFLKLQKEARERRERGEPEPKPTKEEEPVEVAEAAPVPEFANVAEPTPAEAQNGFLKAEKASVPEVEKPASSEVKPEEEKESDGAAAAEANPEPTPTPTPEAEESKEPQLPEDLETKLPDDLEAKLPEDLDAKLPADLETKLPEDLDTKLPEDLESKQLPKEEEEPVEASLET